MKTKSTLISIMFFVCTNLSVTVFALGVNVQDSLALVDLYKNNYGPNWKYHTNWLHGPVSKWYGITVNDNRVIKIALPNNGLLGKIQASIGNLTNLSILNLYKIGLSSLPPEIGNLTNLNTLDLSYNKLSSIPPEIGNLANLNTLDLFNNILTSIPPEIGNLGNLNILVLSYNTLTSLPPEIGNFTNLSSLDLSSNKLTSLPPELGNLTNLVSLYLNDNQLTGSISPVFGNLKYLNILTLNNNQLSGSIPPDFTKLNNPYLLDLSYNHFTFDGMEELLAKKFHNIIYNHQENINVHQNGAALSVSAGGTLSNNSYFWFKVGEGGILYSYGDSVFHPALNGKYYATINNKICKELTLYTDTIDYQNVLPVALINLEAQQQGSLIKVDWSSLTEINMESYEVQRSANANGFSSIGSVTAKGNGTAQQNYSFNDLQPLNGNNYYRLKAIDKDGGITYSKIVLVNISGDKTFTIVYPVPAKDILHIQTNGSASFSLINQAGKILLTTNISGNGSMNVGGLASGLYYLKNNSTGVVQKVVITK